MATLFLQMSGPSNVSLFRVMLRNWKIKKLISENIHLLYIIIYTHCEFLWKPLYKQWCKFDSCHVTCEFLKTVSIKKKFFLIICLSSKEFDI